MRIHLYNVVLFGHITLAIGSFILAAGMHLAMAQLRSARSVTEMRAPARLMHRTGSLLPLFVIALAGFGALLLHLSGGQFGWSDGWVITAVTTLAAVEASGALVLGPRGKDSACSSPAATATRSPPSCSGPGSTRSPGYVRTPAPARSSASSS